LVGSVTGDSGLIGGGVLGACFFVGFFSAIPGFDRGSCVKACAVLIEACVVLSVEASSLSIQTTVVVGLK
jgi:hypothetical protein